MVPQYHQLQFYTLKTLLVLFQKANGDGQWIKVTTSQEPIKALSLR